jgi:S-adenosylmethionine hydrolase
MDGTVTRPPAVVTLTTDFGLTGHHVGAMKGVLLSLGSGLAVVDLCHGIPAGDVFLGAWTLFWNWHLFPPGSIHVAVVDPGVGTSRRALAAAAGGHYFIGPDNGILFPAAAAAGGEIFHLLSVPREASGTFHGRDVFAPAAAHIARGKSLHTLGPPVHDPVKLELPRPRRLPDGGTTGEVIAVDPFGNLVTSITAGDLSEQPDLEGQTVTVGTTIIRGIRKCYGEAEPGGAVAVINSSGHLEIAVNGGRADKVIGADIGDTVSLGPSLG